MSDNIAQVGNAVVDDMNFSVSAILMVRMFLGFVSEAGRLHHTELVCDTTTTQA